MQTEWIHVEIEMDLTKSPEEGEYAGLLCCGVEAI